MSECVFVNLSTVVIRWEEGIRSLRAEQKVINHQSVCWELNLDPLEGQCLLLTAMLFLQPLFCFVVKDRILYIAQSSLNLAM